MLAFLLLSGYVDGKSIKEYSQAKILTQGANQNVITPVKDVGVSVYKNIVTEDFKGCVRLVVDNSIGAAKILFVNVLNTAVNTLSGVSKYVETETQ